MVINLFIEGEEPEYVEVEEDDNEDAAATKDDLMKRYADAKLSSYRLTQGGEHEAQVATRFALEDMESFLQNCRTPP
jgi:hypothetical protein